MTSQSYSKAFTLIELLVVIVIIAIIAGIIFPVVQRARAKAWQIECLSNLHQLGIAELMYAQDYDGYFPPFRNASPQLFHPGANLCTTEHPAPCYPLALHDALGPYVHASQKSAVWFCPDDQFAGQNLDVWGENHLYSSYMYYAVSFINPHLNFSVEGEIRWPGLPPPAPPVIITPASATPLIGDSGNVVANNDGPAGENHFGGYNAVFVDGHARWERPGGT